VEKAEAEPVQFSGFTENKNRLVGVGAAEADELGSIELEHIEGGTGRILGRVDAAFIKGTRRAFEAGDVLFGRLRPYLRKFAFANDAGLCSTEIWVLAADRARCLPEYLYQLVQTDAFLVEVNKSAGSRMPRADWEVLSKITFSLPSIEQQRKVASLLDSEKRAINLLAKLSACFRVQRSTLITRLLSGRLRISRRLKNANVAREVTHA
jgi:type I restriction enzyme S subunit